MTDDLTRRAASARPVRLVPMANTDGGYDPRSNYCELFWLPLLGPASVLLLRRTAFLFDAHPNGCDIDLGSFAASLGLRGGQGRSSTLYRTFDRLRRFHFADTTWLDDGAVEVVRTVHALTPGGVDKLPAPLQAALTSRAWPTR